MTSILQLPAVITKVETRVDKTIKLTVDTQELRPEDAATLFALKGNLGWLLFKEERIEQADIPKEPPLEFKNDKSPGQRLRGVLYVLWEQSKNGSDFETFYRQQVEKIIDFIKQKLD